jgi:hypothetical protein
MSPFDMALRIPCLSGKSDARAEDERMTKNGKIILEEQLFMKFSVI